MDQRSPCRDPNLSQTSAERENPHKARDANLRPRDNLHKCSENDYKVNTVLKDLTRKREDMWIYAMFLLVL